MHSFPPGSAEGIAIQHTCDEAQRITLSISISSVATVFALGCAQAMRNDNILKVRLPEVTFQFGARRGSDRPEAACSLKFRSRAQHSTYG